MNWKEFLRPTRGKIVITIILLILLQFPWMNISDIGCSDCVPKSGFPFVYYIGYTTMCLLAFEYCPPQFYFELFAIDIIIDVIVGYLIGCAMVFAYNKKGRD